MQETEALPNRTHLSIRRDGLFLDGVACKALAEKFGTPLYVLSANRIRENYRALHAALIGIYQNILICPAYKANSHLAVCHIYKNEHAGAEVVSPSELRIALDAGVEPSKIVYNGPMKKQEDLELAIASDVGLINADSVSELEHMQIAARKVKKRCNAGVRINVDIDPLTHPYLATAQREHKFGVSVDAAIDAYRKASKEPELNMIGMHCHLGSNISQPEVISEMADRIFGLASRLKERNGIELSTIDLGGGIGFKYQPADHAISFGKYAHSALAGNLKRLEELGSPALIFEPGRALVADSGVLLTTVNVLKRQGSVNWAIVDAGMNTFLRPALYGAKHQIVLASRESTANETYSVGGPCCESADAFAKGISLPMLKENDVLAILDVGAYGFTMASNYNALPKPAVVLISNSEGLLIRRRESYEDMMAGEIVPQHLIG